MNYRSVAPSFGVTQPFKKQFTEQLGTLGGTVILEGTRDSENPEQPPDITSITHVETLFGRPNSTQIYRQGEFGFNIYLNQAMEVQKKWTDVPDKPAD
jgi:hypothetical protein